MMAMGLCGRFMRTDLFNSIPSMLTVSIWIAAGKPARIDTVCLEFPFDFGTCVRRQSHDGREHHSDDDRADYAETHVG